MLSSTATDGTNADTARPLVVARKEWFLSGGYLVGKPSDGGSVSHDCVSNPDRLQRQRTATPGYGVTLRKISGLPPWLIG